MGATPFSLGPAMRGRGMPGTELAVGCLCAASLGTVAVGAASGVEADDGPTLCPFRIATGLPCPFCGLTRSLMALGQGRLDESVALSPLGVLVPLAAVLAGWRAWRAVIRGRAVEWPRPALIAVLSLVAVSWAFQLGKGAL